MDVISRRAALAAGAGLLIGSARASPRSFVSAPDPYIFNDADYVAGFSATDGRTQVDPRVVAGERTAVFICCGQSNSPGANFVDTQYTPTHPTKVQCLNIYDGAVYLARDPMFGSNTSAGNGSQASRIGDKLITASVFDRVIFATIGMGGSAVATWQPGGGLNARLLAISRRCAAVGLPITAYLWHQGETDTNFGTTQAAYAASLAAMIASVRTIGFSAPWFISKVSYIAGATSNPVRFAQTAAVNGTDIFAGPDTDTLTGGTYRQADNTHFNATGADAVATLWTTAIDAVF